MIGQLDIRTLLLVITLVLVCRSALLVFVWFSNRAYQPVGYWAVGSSVMAMGVLLLGLRDAIPLHISVLTGHTGVITGWMLISAGTLIAADQRPPWRTGIAVSVGALTATCWYLFVTPSYFERTIAVTLPGLLFDSFVAVSCLQHAGTGRRRTTLRILSFVLLVLVITGILKNIHVYHEGVTSLFETSWEMGLYFLSTILGTVVCTVLYILLAAQKIQDDLDGEIQVRQRNEKSMQLASLVFHNTSEAIMVTDADGTIVDVNPAFTELTGFVSDEVLGKTPRILRSDRQDAQFYTDMWREISLHGAWNGELWNCRKDGSPFAAQLIINTLRDADGAAYRRVSMLHDVTQQRLSNEKVFYQANHDRLTGLVNRQYFFEQLAIALSRARRNNAHVGLLYMDLNQFKPVNDNFGHEAGDTVLKAVAERWGNCVRTGDILARLGGDEFALLIGELESLDETIPIAQKLIASLAAPIELPGHRQTRIGASIGIAVYPDHAVEMDSLMAAADAAMYRCKAGTTIGFAVSEVQPQAHRIDSDWVRFGSSDLVGVAVIDDQHRQLVRMVNELNRAVLASRCDSDLRTLFEALIAYAVEHFATEHRLMAQHGYPDTSDHDRQHSKLTEELGQVFERFATGDELQLLQMTKDWLMAHIHHSDKPMGAYLREKGVT